MRATVLGSLFALLFAAGSLLAQVGGDPSATASMKRLVARRVDNRPPVIDGRLNDPAWLLAEPISDFVQKEPNEGARPTDSTEIRILYDDDAIYIGARMHSSDPSRIVTGITKRDVAGRVERILVSLDTYHDRRTCYTFGITVSGTFLDFYNPTDEEWDKDFAFDPVWEGESTLDSAGWSAEMRIPFSQLRFNDLPAQIWGMNVVRRIPATNEDDYWIAIPRDLLAWSSRMGEVVGIEGVEPTRRLELLPYVASSTLLTGRPDPGDPFDDGRNIGANAGLDVKMGLGPNLTLDATINPDFGQVDADPAVVNLSAFETSLEERRPFFIEGSTLLRGIGANYFYSRRIGSAPHLYPNGSYVDMPSAATIIGAAKVTGRLSGGTSLGALGAVTAREHAVVASGDSTLAFDTLEVEPPTGYGVVRLQQEFGDDASTVGAMLTGVHRVMEDESPLDRRLNRNAITGGVDWDLRYNGGEYDLSGYAGFSYVTGHRKAIERVQRSSARYFQRPDADHVELDTSRNSLVGYTAELQFERNSGEHWLGEIGVNVQTPEFEVNDLGQAGSVDDIEPWGTIRYRDTRSSGIVRNYAIAANIWSGWNFGGVRKYFGGELNAETTLSNFWSLWTGLNLGAGGSSDDLTRGGPLMKSPPNWSVYLGMSNNSASTVRWNVNGNYGGNDIGGFDGKISGGVAMSFGGQWDISVDPYYNRSTNARQFLSVEDGGSDATYGKRYVFSYVDQTTISAPIRLSCAVTPRLVVELYAEPFAASGRFYRFGELVAARGNQLREYGTAGTTIERDTVNGIYAVTDGAASFSIGDRDFNIRSFRSNLVLRYEWRPGSTLYLVWQQDRGESMPSGTATIGDVLASIGSPGNHSFALKMTYWLAVE